MRQEDEEGIAQFDPYGQAGFGVGQVLGRDAAKRQQEILTGSSYSANMPPPGYRPGFDPEYLYFGDPRYADYAALLPGVYGDGYQRPGMPIAPTPVAPAPVAPAPGTPVEGIDPTTGLPQYIDGKFNLTPADVDNAMGLIRSGQYDINSLAEQLGVPQAEAYDLYNSYLSDTFGLNTYDRAYDPGLNLDDQAIEALNQQYFNVANQQGFSPEEMSRIFGRPLDQTRDYLSKGYFSDIPVDADYSTDEAQKVYDLYKSGRIGATGISNYFGIPSDDVQRILGEIDTAGGIVSAPSPATDSKPDTAPAVTPIEDINPLSIGLDLYEATGDVLPENQIREIFEYAQDENISYSQLDEMFGQPAGTAQNAASALGMAASAGGIVGMAKGSQFPDFSGDGEITQKDILIGKGVVEKKMQEGGEVDDLTLLQKIRQKISQGMMNTGSDMQESDRIYREDMAPFFGRSPAITEGERVLRRAQAEKDPTFIGRLGEFLEGLGESVSGEQEVNAKNVVGTGSLLDKIKRFPQYQEKEGIMGGMPDFLKYIPDAVQNANFYVNEFMMPKLKALAEEDPTIRARFNKAFRSARDEGATNFTFMGDNYNTKYAEEMSGGGVVGYQDGGYVNRDELDKLIKMTVDAILGDAENADEVIETFISVFGNEAFQQLRDKVLQAQVPDAQTEGMIEGEGGGMDDEVMGMIGNQQRVAVSPGEYIVPADVVASLGDGSSDAGADKLDTMLDDVRVAKTGRTIQPGKIDDRVIPA